MESNSHKGSRTTDGLGAMPRTDRPEVDKLKRCARLKAARSAVAEISCGRPRVSGRSVWRRAGRDRGLDRSSPEEAHGRAQRIVITADI
jgi:hypothetical protein